MGQAREDLAALLRCWRYSLGLPAAVTSGWRALGPLAHAYDAVVAPLVAREVSDTARLRRVNRALCAMSVKIGATMLAYAALAGRPLDIPVAALAGAVTRLYDDLIDRGPTGTSRSPSGLATCSRAARTRLRATWSGCSAPSSQTSDAGAAWVTATSQ